MPDPDNCPAYALPKQNRDLPNFLRSALNQQLSTDRVPACFVLQIQRQDANRYMPIEDTSIEWREQDAPFETVARVTLPPQDFDTPAQNLQCDNLSFNPWFGYGGASPDWWHQSLAQSRLRSDQRLPPRPQQRDVAGLANELQSVPGRAIGQTPDSKKPALSGLSVVTWRSSVPGYRIWRSGRDSNPRPPA
jgi:hypothetical protein